jgi:hypothetical protein
MKPGDYRFQVHIIQAQDIKIENASGSVDP